MITTNQLKENRQIIISRIAELGCIEKTKTFMELMVMDAPFAYDIESLINEVFNTHFRTRSNKAEKIAEIFGNGIKANGTERNYRTENYIN
jgi:hypothetical protein